MVTLEKNGGPRLLAENADGNLSEDDVESAQVIHDSGRHLLGLINDILDMSKFEDNPYLVLRWSGSYLSINFYITKQTIFDRFGSIFGDRRPELRKSTAGAAKSTARASKLIDFH